MEPARKSSIEHNAAGTAAVAMATANHAHNNLRGKASASEDAFLSGEGSIVDANNHPGRSPWDYVLASVLCCFMVVLVARCFLNALRNERKKKTSGTHRNKKGPDSGSANGKPSSTTKSVTGKLSSTYTLEERLLQTRFLRAMHLREARACGIYIPWPRGTPVSSGYDGGWKKGKIISCTAGLYKKDGKIVHGAAAMYTIGWNTTSENSSSSSSRSCTVPETERMVAQHLYDQKHYLPALEVLEYACTWFPNHVYLKNRLADLTSRIKPHSGGSLPSVSDNQRTMNACKTHGANDEGSGCPAEIEVYHGPENGRKEEIPAQQHCHDSETRLYYLDPRGHRRAYLHKPTWAS